MKEYSLIIGAEGWMNTVSLCLKIGLVLGLVIGIVILVKIL